VMVSDTTEIGVIRTPKEGVSAHSYEVSQ